MKCGTRRLERAALTGALMAALAARPAGAKPGDLNNNNGLDTGDVKIALQIAGGRTNGAGQLAAGDVAGGSGNTPDGKITILDAVRIARAINGLDDLGGGGTPGALAVATMQTVTVSGATTRNLQLAPGYLLTGTVKDTAGNSITNTTDPLNSMSGTIAFANAANPYGDDDSNVGADASFSAVVPAGTNTATVRTSVSAFDMTTYKFTSYTVAQTPTPASVVVNGAKTQAFARPDLPVPGTLAGTIAGNGVTISSVNFALDNGGSSFSYMPGASYELASAPGKGTLSFSGALASNSKVTVSAYLTNAPQTVTSGKTTTYNIAIPALSTLTGTVTVPSGVSPSFASVSNIGASGFTGYYSSNSMGGSGAYTLAVPPGSYNLSFSMSAIKNGASSLTWGYNTPVTVSAGTTTKNLTLPAVPATYTVQGTVTGPDGKPYPSAQITAVQSLGAGASGWYAMGNTTSGGNGAYSLTLPAGSYTFLINPPDAESGN